MPSTLSASAQALIATPILRYAKLMIIERTDGTVLRFTDHDVPITFGGQVHSPAFFGTSASEQTSGFDGNNLELKGALSSDAIKAEEIRAGLYRGANLTIVVVDWLYPFVGYIRLEKYKIESSRWTGIFFEAQIVGLTEVLKKKVGRVVGRDCDVIELGDSRCGVDIEAHRKTGTVTAVDLARHTIQTDLTDADGLYNTGKLTWTTAAHSNLDFVNDIKTYENANGLVKFQIRTPYDIEVGNTFSIVPGCYRIREECKGVDGTGGKPWVNNIKRFRGFPDMPGTTIVLKTPDS